MVVVISESGQVLQIASRLQQIRRLEALVNLVLEMLHILFNFNEEVADDLDGFAPLLQMVLHLLQFSTVWERNESLRKI